MKHTTKGLLAIAIFGLVLLSGCNNNQDNPTLKVYENVKVFCDTTTNVEYLIFDGYKAAGLSVRYNSNGSIKQCKQKGKDL